MPSPLRETDLYPPVAEFLEKSGYTVHAEVAGSDITALRDGEILVVELKVALLHLVKRQFSLSKHLIPAFMYITALHRQCQCTSQTVCMV